jgi:hypothetical protein
VNKGKKLILICISAFACFYGSDPALAVNSEACSKLRNHGWWRTYQYHGTGESKMNAITNGTKRDGSSKYSSDSSTENSTYTVDPGASTRISTAGTQGISSWGECSLFAKEMKKERDFYIAQNMDELKKEIARGQGEHIQVLAFYSFCDAAALPALSSELRSDFPAIVRLRNEQEFSLKVDQLIQAKPDLRSLCGFGS